jgi:hypothetical protein
MPSLPADWAAHLESGVSNRLGSSHADGRPEICRGLAARQRPDGRIEVLLNPTTGAELLAAVRATGLVSYVASQPDTNRTLHAKGRDAEVFMASEAEHGALFVRCRDGFMARVEPFGFPRELINGFWFDLAVGTLVGVRFAPIGAWDQTPGPGAGQAIALLP